MSRRLFEKYLRGELTDAEKRRLHRMLARESAARRFAGFVEEWTLFAGAFRRPRGRPVRRAAPLP